MSVVFGFGHAQAHASYRLQTIRISIFIERKDYLALTSISLCQHINANRVPLIHAGEWEV